MAYPDGDFSFVTDPEVKNMLSSMYDAVTKTKNWVNLKKAEPGDGGFMFPSDPELRRIMQEICTADNYTGHNGGTYAWTVRMMEIIAKSGWAAFCAGYIKQQLQSKIAKLRQVYDKASLIYRLSLERTEEQTTPEGKMHFKEISDKEMINYDSALFNLMYAEKELEMLG